MEIEIFFVHSKIHLSTLSQVHTEQSLSELARRRIALGQTWAMFERYSPTQLNFPKFHQPSHVNLAIFLWGFASQVFCHAPRRKFVPAPCRGTPFTPHFLLLS